MLAKEEVVTFPSKIYISNSLARKTVQHLESTTARMYPEEVGRPTPKMPCTLGTRAFRTFTIKLLPRRAASYATYTGHCAVAAIHALAARGLAKEAKRLS